MPQPAATPGLRPAVGRHNISNIVIKVDGNKARSRAYWFHYSNDNPKRTGVFDGFGHYEDELVKVKGRWLFAKRRIYNAEPRRMGVQGYEEPGVVIGPRRGRACTRFLIPTLCSIATAFAAAQERPLPDQDAFLRETRKHLQTDASLQSSYMYVESRREQKRDGRGRVKQERVRVYESYPGLPSEERWERLISEDGKPVSSQNLGKQDAERKKKAEDMAARLTAQPAKERARQAREYAKFQQERDEQVGDIFIVFDIRMLGRETIEGHDTIAFSLTPKAKSSPRTREGEIMRHFAVRAWVSESDHELVRLDANALDTVSFGLGLARLHKGSELSFLRRKINGEAWLPAVFTYNGSGRVGLLWTLRRSGWSEYSGYRKFSVDTAADFRP